LHEPPSWALRVCRLALVHFSEPTQQQQIVPRFDPANAPHNRLAIERSGIASPR
jgi:hypothetical protein